MKRRILLFLWRSLMMANLLFLYSCGQQPVKLPSGIVDDRGVSFSLERRPARIVSLVPSVTEILYSLKGEECLVGVTTYCDFPREARTLPKVGDLVSPSLEKIVDMKPDLLFAMIPLQATVIERLEGLGMKVFVLEPESVEDVQSSIRKIGDLIGREREARTLIQEMEKSFVRIKARVNLLEEKRRVYLELGINPLMTVGESSFVGELIERAGGINIIEGDESYPIVNPERVIAKNPDIILLAHEGSSREEVMKRMGWGEISAIREGRVVDDVQQDIILRPGPRITEGIDFLYQHIYPETIDPMRVESN
jgi:iron complex transport system substrate-binding protein